MKAITLALIGWMIGGITSCHAEKGNGNLITKNIEVSDYKEITIGQGIDCNNRSFTKQNKSPRFNYTQQPGNASLNITIDENLLPFLVIESDGNTLHIKTQDDTPIKPTRLEMNGSSPELRKLRICGGMNFFLKSELSGESLDINASGASDVYLDNPVYLTDLCKITLSGASDLHATQLECDQIECRSSGASDIKMSGKANDGKYRCSGSSDIKSYDFVVKRLDCSASGSSDIRTTVTEKLKASASGSSNIKYKGEAKVEKSTSGASDIDHVN